MCSPEEKEEKLRLFFLHTFFPPTHLEWGYRSFSYFTLSPKKKLKHLITRYFM